MQHRIPAHCSSFQKDMGLKGRISHGVTEWNPRVEASQDAVQWADPGKHRADAPCTPERWPGNKSRHKRAAEAPLGLESCGRNTGTPYGHWLGRKGSQRESPTKEHGYTPENHQCKGAKEVGICEQSDRSPRSPFKSKTDIAFTKSRQEKLCGSREGVLGPDRTAPRRMHILRCVPQADFQAWGPLQGESLAGNFKHE